MIKKLLFSFLLLFLFNKDVFAFENFIIDANVEYKVLGSGKTAITHTITLQNKITYEYAKSYLLELSNLDPKNINAFEKGASIPVQLIKENNNSSINIKFNKPLVGKNEARTFIVTYEVNNLAKKNGDVWEVNIPKILSDYNSCGATLNVPISFGQEALINPKEANKTVNDSSINYKFDCEDLQKYGVNAIFGRFQVYSIKLIYNLENHLDKNNSISVAIPPDTSTQRVYYKNITPAPENIIVDEDGNWISSFKIKPGSDKKVVVEGYVQIFSNPVKLFAPNPSVILSNISPSQYWESDNEHIKDWYIT